MCVLAGTRGLLTMTCGHSVRVTQAGRPQQAPIPLQNGVDLAAGSQLT